MTTKRRSNVPVEDSIYGGLVQMFKRELGIDAQTTLQDDFSDVFQKFRSAGERVEALTMVRPQTLTVLDGSDSRGSAGGIRAHALGSVGVRGGGQDIVVVDGEEGSTRDYIIKLVPCRTDYTLTYITKSFTDLRRFFTKWAFARQTRRLSFNLKYMGVDLAIEIAMGESLSVPQKPQSGQEVGWLQYEAEISVFGYLSQPEDPRYSYDKPTILATDITTETDL